ncbi:hypothetical protein RRG08_012734 [Elysia crispata]|uniref:Uncharacterized protein n=1 Tax=Elysia crispata TaxID=231223 RepID=A0AAE1DKB1_9GAST|nr:hypothetical protein RRG08_012734 [Elysia crispata]
MKLNQLCSRQMCMSHANMLGMAGIMVMSVVSGSLSDSCVDSGPEREKDPPLCEHGPRWKPLYRHNFFYIWGPQLLKVRLGRHFRYCYSGHADCCQVCFAFCSLKPETSDYRTQ